MKTNHLTFQSAKGLVVRVCGLALLYLSSVVAAKILGAEQFGIYSTVLSLSPICAVIVVGGADTFATKAIAITAEVPEKIAAEVAVTHAVGLLGIAVGLIAVGGIVMVGMSLGAPENLCKVLIYCMTLFPLTALILLRQYMSLPIIGVAGAMFPEQIILPTLLCGSMLLASVLSHVTVGTVVLCHMGAALTAWVVGMVQLRDKASLRQALSIPVSFHDVRLRLKRGRPFLLAGLAGFMVTQAVTVLVSLVLGFKEAGLYYAASRLAGLPQIPLGVIDQVVMPSAARFHEKDESSNLARLARTATTLSFFSGAAIALAIALVRKPLLGLFGHEFYAGENVLILLLVGYTVEAFFGPKTAMLKMAGLERAYSRSMIASAIVLPTAVYVAAHLGGAQAVAAAVCVYLVVFHGALSWFLYLKTGAKSIPYSPVVLFEHLGQQGWNGSSLSHKIGIIRGLFIS